MNSAPSARMFMYRALEKIHAEKEIKRSHHSQLKRAVEQALGEWNVFFVTPTTATNAVLFSGKSSSALCGVRFSILSDIYSL